MMGFETLQVIENMESLKADQKEVSFQEWTVNDVVNWLIKQDLEQYAETFKKNEINGKTLMTLTGKDLKEDLGVEVLGHRKQILKQVDLFKVLIIFYPALLCKIPQK